MFLLKVGVLVTPVKSAPGIRGMSCVIVILPAVMELASKIALSCGKGTRAGVAPPEVVNQFEADQLADAPVTM